MSTFDDALLFKTIVEQGSLSRAGEQLGINASAVSKRLARLEQALDTELLRRTTRRISLTESGQYFYQQLVTLDAQWQSTWDETRSLGREPKGILRIATPQPVASRFLMPLLQRFQAQYPKIRLDVRHEQYDQLPASGVDVSICRELKGYQSSTVAASYLCSYHNALFAAPEYLARHRPVQHPQDLTEHACLCYGQSLSEHRWQFIGTGVEVSPAFISNNTEVLINAAVQGMGIVYLPELLIQQEIKAGQLTRLLPELRSPGYNTYAYFTRTQVMAQKVRVLLDFIQQACTEMAFVTREMDIQP